MNESGLPLMRTVAEREVYSVSRLNREARALLEGSLPLLWVEGEISNLARPGSGHMYFTLKDAQAQVRCAMFRMRNMHLKFAPENGMQVLARARVSLYEGRGEFQLLVDHLEPAGDGLLRLAFERLKHKLAAEGLFAEAQKKPIPKFPGCIGVITSPTGAAIRDILSVLKRRFPAIPVIVYPVPVQGDTAAPQIAAMIRRADLRRECDVLILSRGGGSLEDLWPFNEETVARAIYACDTPIVSGVGHEIDFTIADFVADLRAPTPSAAAELVSPDAHQWLRHFAMLESRLLAAMKQRLARRREQMTWLSRRLVHPGRRLLELAQRLDDLNLRLAGAARNAIQDRRLRLATLSARLQQMNPGHTLRLHLQHSAQLQRRLVQAMQQRLLRDQARLGALSRALGAVSPLATLDRGYAIVSADRDGAILRSGDGVDAGERITARLARDRLHCRVEKVEKDPERE